MQLNLKAKMKMKIKKNKLILVFLIVQSIIFSKNYFIYATAESEDEVSLLRFDGNKIHLHENIKVGVNPVEIEGPHGINISPDGDYWFLSMAHGVGSPNGILYKYSTKTNNIVDQVELGFFPATLEVSRSTGLLYIVNFNLHGGHDQISSVSIVDPELMIEIERVETGVMPHGSRLLNNGLKHYSVAMMSGELFELDAAEMVITRKLKTSNSKMSHHSKMHHNHSNHNMDKSMPTWVYPSPDDKLLYVVNSGTNEVLEIDIKRWSIQRKFSTSKGPYNCEVSNDGKYLVVTYKPDGYTGIWDLNKGIELAKIKNSRKVSHGVVISPDSKFAFVTVEGIGGEPGTVDVIDLQKLKLIDQIDIGKQAGGIAFWKMED
tara:strand:- start:1586 stop:2710 length:1125 start_codon:yes stop_codon:yes gene_type:complete